MAEKEKNKLCVHLFTKTSSNKVNGGIENKEQEIGILKHLIKYVEDKCLKIK